MRAVLRPDGSSGAAEIAGDGGTMKTAAMLKHLMLGLPRLKLAVAESMTAGRLQALIAAESGASEFFLGGITAYTLEQKVRHLGVSRELAAPVDCVSAEVAWQMARGACALFGADVAVATTGYAEPASLHGFAEPGVYWALCHRLPDGSEARCEGIIRLAGADRTGAQERAAQAAYLALAGYLEGWRREVRD
jgi:nicotinamide-nucleotide amidase